MEDRSLQDFVQSVNGKSHLRVETDFGDGFVRLQTSEAERRQAAQDIRCTENIVLEMLRNSRDAHATHIYLAVSREGAKRCLTVIDDGCGIPTHMHALVFEPRVTSKLDTSHMDAWGMHGRGMALYSISVNAEEARVVDSDTDRGAALLIRTDTESLPEKTDQSTFPTFTMGDEGTVNVRGPRNILRTACEFAIETRATCDVFVGSPAEVAATLYAYGTATLPTIDRLFCHDISTLPLCKRLATAADAAQFADIAASLGLKLSERTARRIMDGEICELDPIIDQITLTNSANKGSNKTRKATPASVDARGFKLMAHDSDMLKAAVKDAFADIAESYYLEQDVEPIVRARRDRITITVPVVKHP